MPAFGGDFWDFGVNVDLCGVADLCVFVWEDDEAGVFDAGDNAFCVSDGGRSGEFVFEKCGGADGGGLV